MPPIKYLVLGVYVLAVLAVQLRGRRRHSFLRQLTDQSSLLAPYNVFMYLFSAVPSRGRYVDVARFPELAPLQQNWRMLREEALALSGQGLVGQAPGPEDASFDSFFRKGWKRFYLKWYGRPLPSADRLCPRSAALVESVPAVRAALFVQLPPGSRLDPHRDPFAGSLRYHLGLATPNSDLCRILVDGEPYSWRDGEAVVFDETYLHEAENGSDQDRLILFCDIERPLHTPVMRWLNRVVGGTLGRATAARNAEGDPLGMVNRLYAGIHHAGLWRRRFKRANRGLYEVLRVGAVAALIWLFWIW